MINLKMLKESDAGRFVLYTGGIGLPEVGKLKRWGARFAYVDFDGSGLERNIDPEYLSFVSCHYKILGN